MKSLVLTGILALGVAHAGAFLSIWNLPHVEDHVTVKDFGRKLDKVFKWDEKSETLRDARTAARDENYALYQATPEQEARRKALQSKKR